MVRMDTMDGNVVYDNLRALIKVDSKRGPGR